MRIHFGTLLLSFTMALVLWGMAHGTSSIETSVDIPVVFDNVPKDVVITGQSVDAVNVRVLGSRAALRNVNSSKLDYRIDIGDSQPGPAIFEVDETRIERELPRGARIVSRSPSSIEVSFEQRGRKALRVRPDIAGSPAEGYAVGTIEVDPPRIWITGARSDVLRLSEVVTETIDIEGATESVQREVRLALGSDHVWRERDESVSVRVEVVALPAGEGAETDETAAAPARRSGA